MFSHYYLRYFEVYFGTRRIQFLYRLTPSLTSNRWHFTILMFDVNLSNLSLDVFKLGQSLLLLFLYFLQRVGLQA